MNLPEKRSEKFVLVPIGVMVLVSLALIIEEVFNQPIKIEDFLLPISLVLLQKV
ncbi:hypothetical protein M1O19_05090 [Dehalococcoidia bacterium]|nr:hypothetical protein [Dehalococcoidia bacterium]MCL0097878.1 hypothetical protein [Dehalococcoidia bacterium]